MLDNVRQIKMPEYAVVVPQTTHGRIIMEGHYKHWVGKVSLMFPEGFIENGEESFVAAKRELLEETGYVTDDWQFLGSFVANANYGCGKTNVYAA